MSDPDWPDVEALQNGDQTALDRLIERHRRTIQGFVQRMIGDASAAEEIAQETFVRAYFRIHRYHPRSPFAAWLFEIARNLCRDYFRSRAYRQRASSVGLEWIEKQPNPTNSRGRDEKEDQISRLTAALDRLPLALRECLVLTALEGLSHKDAALRLGLSPKAVEVKSYRARKLLEKFLGKA
jgi:RNA polymerase sigma-70 factor (ECF subfamily)